MNALDESENDDKDEEESLNISFTSDKSNSSFNTYV